MNDIIQSLASIFVLAILIEGITEYFISDPNKKQPWLKYAAAGLGIIVSVAYKVDLLAALGVTSAVPLIGELLTGLVIGRGSNYLNEFIGKVRGVSTKVEVPSKSTASVNIETTGTE